MSEETKTRTVTVRRWGWAQCRVEYEARDFEVPADLPADEVMDWVDSNDDGEWVEDREVVSDNVDDFEFEVTDDPDAPSDEDEVEDEDSDDDDEESEEEGTVDG